MNPFVPFIAEPKGMLDDDIMQSKSDCQIALHVIQKFYDFDLDKITVCGTLEDKAVHKEPKLYAVVFDEAGEVWQTVTIESAIEARVHIRPKGCEIADKLLPATRVGNAWIIERSDAKNLEARPKGRPRKIERKRG